MAIEVGQKLSGKVTGITNFGAFISLPENKTGLVHISEVSNGFVKEIASILTVGQEVEVKVLSIAADGKISLSIRQAEENYEKPVPKPKRERVEREESTTRPPRFEQSSRASSNDAATSGRKLDDFDQLMSNFLKDSEDRLSSLRRNTEGKRGGRGGRRS